MTGTRHQNPLWGADWPEVRALWPIDPSIAHLNHGSFGAVPLPVLEEQDRWRREAEANPTGFFFRLLPDEFERARVVAADFLHADPDGFLFVPNATAGIATILASLDLRRGDQILVTDHCYGAIRLSAERTCNLSGATLVVQPVPLGAGEELLQSVLAGVTERTRLAVVDHIASPTALVFPVADTVRELRARGVLSMVDGAHAPGMVDVDISRLDPDFWTGNFHKWCCSPRGSAGLYVRADHRDSIAPLVTSWFAKEGLIKSFSWTGTADYSPWLSVPAAIDFMAGLGWGRVRAHNSELAGHGRDVLARALGTEPVPGEFEAMTLVALPDGSAATDDEARALSDRIAGDLRTEVAVTVWGGCGFIRLSAQAYNCPDEYDRLADGLPALLRP